MKAAALRRLPEQERHNAASDYLLYLEDENFLEHYQWRMTRTAPPKCIRCGNSAYILIDEQKRDTGITHEYCWNSPIECIPPHICSAEYRSQINCYHALTGELNWLHIHERAVISCMTDDPCKIDLRKAAYAIVRYKEKEAFDILETLAKENRIPAMTALGTLYLFGIGVEADGELAIHYLSKALKVGDGLAAMNLSRLYWAGMAGIKADEEKTRSYMKTAREMGIYIR
ncbi:tetratricopeptide repeat protein [Undibacterium sp. Ji83W]|uniref:tetratricopeptide repeat protein n=1 Tax=Undibacterium sp. Ji83W TaxID=3413043 RepID=UPI003BF2188F